MKIQYSQRLYDQRIGNLVVEFLDYLYQHRVDAIAEGQDEGLDLNKSLSLFADEQGLNEKDLDSMAVLLDRYGYEVTPEEAYTDRRVAMKKRAQVRPPVDDDFAPDITEDDYDYNEILEVGQDLVDAYHSLNLPPQSMTVFMPLGHNHDEVLRTDPDSEDWARKMELYFRTLGKVIKYLDNQGYEMDAHQQLLHEYVDHFYNTTNLTASQNRKLLAFAAKLQERGSSESARRIMKIIQAVYPGADPEDLRDIYPEEYYDYEEDEKTEIMEGIPSNPFDEYRLLLAEEKYDEARDLYSRSSPEMREELDKIGQDHFAVTNIAKLHRFGQKLYNEKSYMGAYRVKKALENILQDLPLDDQQQIVIFLVPDGVDLPQAFDAQKKNKEVIDTKMTDMMDRLSPCASNNDSNKHKEWTKEEQLELGDWLHESRKRQLEKQKENQKEAILRVLKLADQLDEQGHHKAATALDKWIKKTADEAHEMYLQERFDEDLFSPEEVKKQKPKGEVHSTTCRGCGVDMYYAEGDIPPKYCRNCEKEPWGTRASLRRAQIQEKETAVSTCAGCGNEVYYKKSEGAPKYCYQCKKDMWGAQASLKRKAKEDDHGGKPAKVVEIADAIRRDEPGTSDSVAFAEAWETYCSYVNPSYEGCTEKGKSKRKSPKPYEVEE